MLNYSTIEVNIQIQKLISSIILIDDYLRTIMLNTKKFKSNTFKCQ